MSWPAKSALKTYHMAASKHAQRYEYNGKQPIHPLKYSLSRDCTWPIGHRRIRSFPDVFPTTLYPTRTVVQTDNHLSTPKSWQSNFRATFLPVPINDIAAMVGIIERTHFHSGRCDETQRANGFEIFETTDGGLSGKSALRPLTCARTDVTQAGLRRWSVKIRGLPSTR